MIRLRLRARQALGELLYRIGFTSRSLAPFTIFMYHSVTPRPVEDPMQLSVSAALFDDQLAALHSLGVEVVPLEEGIQRLANGAGGAPAVSIVFDDGYVGVHDYALQTLVRHRIPATIFLATHWIGHSTFPWSPPALGRPLTWNELATLVRVTHCSVGSHTHRHLVLTALDSASIRKELAFSKATIQDRLGMTPQLFAYPHGSYGTFDGRTRQILSEEGFRAACTTVWGRNRCGDDAFTLKRIRVSWCDSVGEMRKSLEGGYDWYRIIQRAQATRPQRGSRYAPEAGLDIIPQHHHGTGA